MKLRSLMGGAAATVAVGALLFTYGCTQSGATGAMRAQELTAGAAGTPVVVSCEPHQRTLVRQTVVNGAAVSQVECVAADRSAYAQPAPAPVAYGYAPAPQVAAQPRVVLPDAQVVPVDTYPVARPVRTRQVVYDERVVKPRRSVKKSAVIIGSSAGVGAGVGAAVGGKKGALIGAAIGGGSAAIWDQVTRR
jgi:hypothetical protein